MAFGPGSTASRAIWTRSSRRPAPCGPLGRGQGQAHAVGDGPVGRAAATPLYRPGHRHLTGRHPHGRTMFGTRPAFHPPDRGVDGRARQQYTIVIVTHNMQQAARASDFTVFMNMAEDRAGYVVEQGDDVGIFTNPKNQMTEDYVSGRFGYDRKRDPSEPISDRTQGPTWSTGRRCCSRRRRTSRLSPATARLPRPAGAGDQGRRPAHGLAGRRGDPSGEQRADGATTPTWPSTSSRPTRGSTMRSVRCRGRSAWRSPPSSRLPATCAIS